MLIDIECLTVVPVKYISQAQDVDLDLPFVLRHNFSSLLPIRLSVLNKLLEGPILFAVEYESWVGLLPGIWPLVFM